MRKRGIVTIILLLIVAVTALGQIREIMFTEPLNFKGVTLSDAVGIISADAEINVTSDEKSKDKVLDLYFSPGVTLDVILDTIAVSNDLKLVTISPKNYMFTSKKSESTTLLSGVVKLKEHNSTLDGVKVTVLDSGLPPVVTTDGGKYLVKDIVPGTYIVRYERTGFITEGEFISVYDKKSTIVDVELSKTNEGVKTPISEESKSRAMGISQHDTGRNSLTEKISVTNVSADEVKAVLEKIFGEEIIISSFPKLSMLIVKSDPNTVKIAKNIANDMDSEVKQVRIAAQTLEITDNLFEDLGFKWAYAEGSLEAPPEQAPGPGDPIPSEKPSAINSSGIAGGILDTFVPGAGMASSLNLVKFFDDKNSFLSFTINALQTTTDATVSAVPSILVINGEKGRFDMTEEQLVSYTSVVTPSGSAGNLTTTQAITGTAGIILEVTPIIKTDSSILLYINVESSNFTGNPNTITASGGYNPKVSRKLTSTVLINNGDTIFIGGMKTAQSTDSISKVPYLGDIPYIGKLFTSTAKSNKLRDIYIKLKVDIVNSEQAKTELDYKDFKNMDFHTPNAEKTGPDATIFY